MRPNLILHTKRAFSASNKLLHGRNTPLTYAYKQLSNVELDIEPFQDESCEQNRTESELIKYLSSVREYVQKRRYAAPKYNNSDKNKNKNELELEQPLFKPLYDYSKTKSTEIDQRPPYYKFMENIEKTNPDLYNELTEPLPVENLIDMNYLALHENKNVPKVLPDDQYPEWVWELVPESRRYWWTDLIQTPFENLCEVEKFQLFRKWRKTLMISNNSWNKSHLGYLGKVRAKYNDPWPQPLTKMDIHKYQKNDKYYQTAKITSQTYTKRSKNKKRLESNTDYLKNQNLITNDFDKQNILVLNQDEEGDIDIDIDGEMEPQTIDLAKYYGLDEKESDINVDRDYEKKYGVVYNVKQPLEK